jgi:hypothetical protein
LAQRQWPLQIGNLFFSLSDLLSLLGDLPIPFDYLLTELLDLTLLPLHLPLQFFPSGRTRVRLPTGYCLLACAPGRLSHPSTIP